MGIGSTDGADLPLKTTPLGIRTRADHASQLQRRRGLKRLPNKFAKAQDGNAGGNNVRQ
jgi:hypothetical protein